MASTRTASRWLERSHVCQRPVSYMCRRASATAPPLGKRRHGGRSARFSVPTGSAQPLERRPIVGFRLCENGVPHEHERIAGPLSLAGAVISAGMRARESLPRVALDENHLVKVPAHRDPLDSSLSGQQAQRMFHKGRTMARKWSLPTRQARPDNFSRQTAGIRTRRLRQGR